MEEMKMLTEEEKNEKLYEAYEEKEKLEKELFERAKKMTTEEVKKNFWEAILKLNEAKKKEAEAWIKARKETEMYEKQTGKILSPYLHLYNQVAIEEELKAEAIVNAYDKEYDIRLQIGRKRDSLKVLTSIAESKSTKSEEQWVIRASKREAEELKKEIEKLAEGRNI